VQKQDQIIDLDSEVRAAVSRLSELLLERENTAARIQDLEARVRSTQAFRNQEAREGVSATSMTTNPVIGGLRTRLSDMRSKRQALLLDTHTVMSPEVREYDFQIAAAEAELAAALSEMAGLDPVVAQYRTELAGLRHKSLEITQGIQRTTTAFAAYPEKMRKLSQLELAATAAEAVYRSLQDQRFQIGIAEAMTMSDVRIVAPAALPESASHPKSLLNLLAGIFLGLGFGFGTAFLFEYVDDSIKSAEAVREVWPLPHLGLVPRYKPGNKPALLTLPPTDPLAESHRTIRNAIGYASLDKPLRLLAITSSLPSEGKSTLAMNLAISMAREGKRVLLVDADLRKPRQHTWFDDIQRCPGLVDLVGGTATAVETIQETPVEGLSLLVAGDVPPDPAQVVESLRMRHILSELARGYDMVLVDTPPVLPVGDALAIGRMVDRVILVAEPLRVTRRMLAEARSRFEAARVEPLGVVMSKVRGLAGVYGYAGYYGDGGKKKSERGVA
jgi:capsular exopolysaccharide synthesis family protein